MALSIAPIGSCRIVDPLRKAREKFGFQMNRNRTLGFTHSSAEAVQQLRFMKGEIEIPDELWPCVSNQDREKARHQEWKDSDIYVVELSSEKEFRVGQIYLQLNYLSNYFSGFFADRERKNTYRKMIERAEPEEVAKYLDEVWSANAEQEADSNILRQIRCTRATEESLRADVKYLAGRLPNVVFVTHVNAEDKTGKLVESRNRYIELVKLVARLEGCLVYDPTTSMREVGQEASLEEDINHYTEDFKLRVVEDMFEGPFARLI